ncbi:MAG: nucleoside phosphorylase [Candidatus Nanoarchaeia archaeon]
MTYPKFKNKHRQEALFNPLDFIKYKKHDLNLFPKKYILVYQLNSLKYIKSKYSQKQIKLDSIHQIHVYKDIGFVKVGGIGGPSAVTLLEELIAVGGKEFLSLGTAGGLQKQGVFLCNKALRDEGTSYHYIPHGNYSFPDKNLTTKLGKAINKTGLIFEPAASWTIDAPYRETKAEIKKYKKQGIATVEMEASALFAVAKYRKVKIASAFVVSDILGEKWNPLFHTLNLKRTLRKLIDSGIECLK